MAVQKTSMFSRFTNWFTKTGDQSKEALLLDQSLNRHLFQREGAELSPFHGSALGQQDPPGFVRYSVNFKLQRSGITIVSTVPSAGNNIKLQAANLVCSYKALKAEISIDLTIDGADFSAEASNGDILIGFQMTNRTEKLVILKYTALEGVKEVSLRTSQMSYKYHPQITQILIAFLTIDHSQESLNLATLSRVESSLPNSEILNSNTVLILNIFIAKSIIIWPTADGQAYLKMSTGQLAIRNAEEGTYHRFFELSLSEVSCYYAKVCSKNTDLLHNEADFPVLEQCELTMRFGFLMPAFSIPKHQNDDSPYDSIPDVEVSAKFKNISLMVSTSVYSVLINANKLLGLDQQPQLSEVSDAEDEVKRIQHKQAILTANVRSRFGIMKGFSDNFAVLTKAHIYLYADPTNLKKLLSFSLKGCLVEEVSEDEKYIDLSTRNQKLRLNFANWQEHNAWKAELIQCINDLNAYVRTTTQRNLGRGHKTYLKCILNLERMSLTFANENKDSWLDFVIAGLRTKTEVTGMMQKVSLSLAKFEACDHIITQNKFKQILQIAPYHRNQKQTSESDVLDKLMRVRFKWFNNLKASEAPEQEDMVGSAVISALKVNWNPDVITTLLNFFMIAQHKSETSAVPKSVSLMPNHVLIKFNLEVREISVSLSIPGTNLALVQCTLIEISNQLIVKNSSTTVTGSLRKLKISDMTEYPYTANIFNHGSAEAFEMLSVR